MFYTSAITSILPYILFLGIMCTYYLGIVNEALISGENGQIGSNTEVFLIDKNKTTFEKNYHINSGALDFCSDNQRFSAPDTPIKITFPENTKNRTEEDVYFCLFSRPPPYSSILLE